MNALKIIRVEIFDMAQSELGILTDTPQSSISKWERGVGKPDMAFLTKVRDEAIRRDLPWVDSFVFLDAEAIQKEVAEIKRTREQGIAAAS